ncbi:serine hydrolase [Mangrovibacterium diazotrophicum]|uniref:beta-lactamase n=1 Tax=Mangrovibacterium diazotrophicum TaxID=1261403 RepID=A0A419W7A7_9BACT|nr:serine hydrolase [Mangrovibacterium diazotrophicum]RKD91242.1 beta-lactamase family protein [Mangrovibacterium diazotrophicum]
MKIKTAARSALIALLLLFTVVEALPYPIDGYAYSGIRRLLRLQKIIDGEVKDTKPIPGALKSINDIKLNLLGTKGDSLVTLPDADKKLQQQLSSLFPNLDESYSVALMDITPGKKIRYAGRQETKGFQPGSVGKLAVLAGLFTELANLYPDSYEKRIALLKTKMVRAGTWGNFDSHTVPFYNPETGEFFKRTVREDDVFSLFEWADHMLSVSNNSAASIVWREVMLMRAFGKDYPALTEAKATEYFTTTPKATLKTLANEVVNAPLRKLDITEDEWRLGSMFTQGAKKIVPGEGGSIGTPRGLMKYLVAMERGKIVDQKSSLEIKRLMYMTDRRIRYGSSPRLTNAAIYFKSGSLYKCKPEEGFECKKYMGNVENYMNSVVIVEQPDGTIYMVALMSNVLKKNSNLDHLGLGSSIDDLIRKK